MQAQRAWAERALCRRFGLPSWAGHHTRRLLPSQWQANGCPIPLTWFTLWHGSGEPVWCKGWCAGCGGCRGCCWGRRRMRGGAALEPRAPPPRTTRQSADCDTGQRAQARGDEVAMMVCPAVAGRELEEFSRWRRGSDAGASCAPPCCPLAAQTNRFNHTDPFTATDPNPLYDSRDVETGEPSVEREIVMGCQCGCRCPAAVGWPLCSAAGRAQAGTTAPASRATQALGGALQHERCRSGGVQRPRVLQQPPNPAGQRRGHAVRLRCSARLQLLLLLLPPGACTHAEPLPRAALLCRCRRPWQTTASCTTRR